MKKIIVILGIVFGVVALVGIFKFNFLASLNGYDVDGNKVTGQTTMSPLEKKQKTVDDQKRIQYEPIVEKPIIKKSFTKNSDVKTHIVYAGARASSYGFNNFPSPTEFGGMITNIASEVGETAVPSSVWIVSVIGNNGETHVEFPNASGKSYDHIVFSDTDKHEAYLNHFDAIGVKVFLQVEAGHANMEDLITLVLSRYKDHPSVAGFGIDVEWFPSNGQAPNGVDGGTKLTNADVARYDALVKSFNPEYRIFVKHWDPDYCGSGPVSDVIYIDDSQELGSLEDMVEEFGDWGKAFYPNDVGFQVGYESDYAWWKSLNNPIKDISTVLKDKMNNQVVHFYWVDFTLNYDELK